MFNGYDGEPELTERGFHNGYFFPGDRGRKDASGRVWLTGRESEFINVGANKVEPVEIEAALAQHSKVSEVVVLGVTNAAGEESVKAIVVASEACEAEELLDFCRGRIADFKVPRIIEFRDELPRGPLGGVLRKYLD